MTKHVGIPTEYKGYRFRSINEARWAAFADLEEVGWPWVYEPGSLKHYIPDLILRFDWSPLLLEAKSDVIVGALARHAPKIQRSGWEYDAMIVGGGLVKGHPLDPHPTVGIISQRDLYGAEPERGGDWDWGDAELFRCANCERISVKHGHALLCCYFCGYGSQCQDIGNSFVKPLPVTIFEELWAEAHRKTQWIPPRQAAGRA